MDYAVNWDFDKILRDLIQNFYDSIGWEDFSKDFDMKVTNDKNDGYKLVMKNPGHPFSYEWLTHIGGSTKTDSGNDYIGKYGEGFKICALCLLKDKKTIRMESAGWRIDAVTYYEKIADKKIPMLGYMLNTRQDDGYNRLTVSGLKKREINATKEALLNFFYPENPLIGKKLAQCNDYAVYLRSSMPIPCRDTTDIPGILFWNRLARGRLSIPVVIQINSNNPGLIKDTRDRKALDYNQTRVFLNSNIHIFDSETSYKLLLFMKDYWNDIPHRMVDFYTWYYVICQLVRNVSANCKLKKIFMKRYHNLIYIEREGSDKNHNKQIREASEWAHSNPKYSSLRFVNPIFRMLGAKNVLDDYRLQRANLCVEASELQKKLCNILFLAFKTVFPYHIYNENPEIFISDGIYTDPMQYCVRDYSRNRKGRRYRIRRIVLDISLFNKESFWEAFFYISDCFLHVYGTNKSSAINNAYTDLCSGIIDNAKCLIEYKELWESEILWERDQMGSLPMPS